MKHLTIGQMAKSNRISEQTLRLYDRIGLLCPSEVGEQNRYRYYNMKQCAQLDMIQYMKSLGMGLKEIKQHFDSRDLPRMKLLLDKKSAQLSRQLQELRYQQRAVERMLDSLERCQAAPPDGSILVEYIGKRRMYCIDSHTNFYDYSLEVYEEILRELKESLITDELPQIYFCNAGSILRYDNLMQRRFVSTEVFVFVDADMVAPQLTTEIPAATYLCIYCDRFEKEKEYALRLLEHAESSGYRIAGDYICEALSDLPIFGGGEREMFLRLQLPISYR